MFGITVHDGLVNYLSLGDPAVTCTQYQDGQPIEVVHSGLQRSLNLSRLCVYSRLNMKLPSWIATALILFIITSLNSSRVNCQSFKRTNSGVSFAQFVGNPFTRLNASLLATLQVSSLDECSFECINHHDCFSVNFGNQAHGKYTCELMNTDKFNQPDKFAISQEFYHYNIKVGPDSSVILAVKSSV